jgi:hypothetical protein
MAGTFEPGGDGSEGMSDELERLQRRVTGVSRQDEILDEPAAAPTPQEPRKEMTFRCGHCGEAVECNANYCWNCHAPDFAAAQPVEGQGETKLLERLAKAMRRMELEHADPRCLVAALMIPSETERTAHRLVSSGEAAEFAHYLELYGLRLEGGS